MSTSQSRPVNCAVEACISVIGGRWKSLILWNLRGDALRFSELQKLTEGISKRMLTHQLRELEKDGIVHRTDYQEVIPHTDYRLTEKGRTLRPILASLHQWGLEHTDFIKR